MVLLGRENGGAGTSPFFLLPSADFNSTVRPMSSQPQPLNTNPLIQATVDPLPDFEAIRPEHVLPALQQALQQARQCVAGLLSEQGEPDWLSLMRPLEAMDERLSRLWGPVVHLNAVKDSDALRTVYQQGIAMMAEWETELAQNEAVYAAMHKLHESAACAALTPEQQQVLQHALRDFRLAGAELAGENKTRFKAIAMRASELGSTFEQHLLDATRAFELHLTHEQDTAGLPASVRDAARQRASQQEKLGWLITLDAPSYVPFMQHADSRALRERMYTAYVTRASDGARDNAPVIDEILALRQEAAELLGYANYAEVSLAKKMAPSVEAVRAFLLELAEKSRPFAERELDELRRFASRRLGLSELCAWDIPYASEKLRQSLYDISQEELKPYFPEARVFSGMFALVEKLYGINIRETEAPKWHESVRYFEVLNGKGEKLAAFYVDPYARAHKRGGAWMDECIIRWRRDDGSLQLPVAYLVCNFDAPVGDKPALWTHDEVTTLFHEFGHGLHHMLTEVEEIGVSGIRGVPWDAVELPSQFMENFCWQREVVDMFARHYATGASIPDDLFRRMLSARNFQSGMQMLRQIELAMFDLDLHSRYRPKQGQSVQQLLDGVREAVAVLKPPAFNRFQNSFSHIFAGGYAAGYFAYKWAEVLSADAFAAFEEEGITSQQTAQRFRREILSVGGSRDIMQAYIAFRGREPGVDALLRHSGLQG